MAQSLTTMATLLSLLLSLTTAFIPQQLSHNRHHHYGVLRISSNDRVTITVDRRAILPVPAIVATLLVDSSSAIADMVKPLSREEAEQRFRAGRKSLQYLLDHYPEICQGGGDNVRRYLGTVGTTSGLFGIGKALKVLGEDVEDIVEYSELATEIEKSIQQADGSAYMAIFVTFSTSSTPPSQYFKDAQVEIVRCAAAMDQLAKIIGLQLED